MLASITTAACRAAVCVLALAVLSLSPTARANTTAGVFGPVVNDGHRSWQYRAAYDHDSFAFTHRLHAQSAVNDDLMVRGVVQARKTDARQNDFDLFQAEVFWQLGDVRPNWQQGFRLDLTWREGDRPGSVGLHWMNQWTASEWQLRSIVMTDVQFGRNNASGVGLQSRLHATRPFRNGWSAGVEMYSRYGRTGDLASGGEQSHLVGPVVAGQLGGGWSVFSGLLFGVTSGSPDAQVRVWLTRRMR